MQKLMQDSSKKVADSIDAKTHKISEDVKGIQVTVKELEEKIASGV
jgi:hypothetical protein